MMMLLNNFMMVGFRVSSIYLRERERERERERKLYYFVKYYLGLRLDLRLVRKGSVFTPDDGLLRPKLVDVTNSLSLQV